MIFLALAACEPSTEQPSPVTDDSGVAPLPTVSDGIAGLDDLPFHNVVLVHVDTLRADRMPRYGYTRDTQPGVDTHTWLRVDGYTAMDTWTLPSTTTMLSGRFPQTHGVTHLDASGQPNVEPTMEMLAEHLHANGIATFGGSGNSVVQEHAFLSRGFDTTTDYGSPDAPRDLRDLAPAGLDWIDGLPEGQPFFLFLQPMDVHAPYNPSVDVRGTWTDVDDLPFALNQTEDEQVMALREAWVAADDAGKEAIRAALDGLYDETILSLDLGFDVLYQGLEDRGLLDDTLLVFSADHGETLLDDTYNPGFGHGGTARRELTHIPLMFHHPLLPDQDVDCLSQNADLAPTLLEAWGLPPMDDIDGEALQGGCRTMARASTFHSDNDGNEPFELMVTDGQEQLRWVCSRQLAIGYDLTTDPDGEVSLTRYDLDNGEALEIEMLSFNDTLQANLGAEPCVAW